MSIANDKPLKRRPTHPGHMLRQDFLPDFGLTASKLAAAVRCRAPRCSNRRETTTKKDNHDHEERQPRMDTDGHGWTRMQKEKGVSGQANRCESA